MGNPSFRDQDYSLLKLVNQTGELIVKIRERELKQYGISPRQAATLFAMQSIGSEATPAKISRWLLREPHTVSGILSRMEKQGLIKKAKNLDRKNMVRVMLTRKGRRAYHQSSKRDSIHWLASSLSEEERQQLRSCLETLRDRAFKELGIDRKPLFP